MKKKKKKSLDQLSQYLGNETIIKKKNRVEGKSSSLHTWNHNTEEPESFTGSP